VGGGIRRKLNFISSDAWGRLSRPRAARTPKTKTKKKRKKKKKKKGDARQEMEGGVRAEFEKLTGGR
jgi:hypothetical protein